MNNIYVVGTDTGVGKTVLSLLLMQYLLKRGLNAFYLKPLQTGCKDVYDVDSDAAFVYRHVEAFREKDPAESVIYCFKNPKAPYFAARDEDREIDLNHVNEVIEGKSRHYSPLVIETAGGLLVPVKEKALMVDTISAADAGVVLAARAGLGTINHTLLSVEALASRGMRPAGIVFLDTAETPQDMVAENREAIERHSGIKVAGVVGKIDDFSHPPEAFYRPIEFLLQEGIFEIT
jgi:dethiobiotin synthetase